MSQDCFLHGRFEGDWCPKCPIAPQHTHATEYETADCHICRPRPCTHCDGTGAEVTAGGETFACDWCEGTGSEDFHKPSGEVADQCREAADDPREGKAGDAPPTTGGEVSASPDRASCECPVEGHMANCPRDRLAQLVGQLRRTVDRLDHYTCQCPCPGVSCVESCSECHETQRIVNAANDVLRNAR